MGGARQGHDRGGLGRERDRGRKWEGESWVGGREVTEGGERMEGEKGQEGRERENGRMSKGGKGQERLGTRVEWRYKEQKGERVGRRKRKKRHNGEEFD